MIKFNSNSNKGRSTDTSIKNLTPLNRFGQDKTVTPFVCQDITTSPINKKLDSSPLQIPLALAIKQLVNGQGQKRLSRPKTSAQCYAETPVHFITSDNSLVNEWIDEKKLLNLKNILQQFMESLYYELEKDLEAKFSVQMKRIIIKYRETERAVKHLQNKLTNHADIVETQAKMKVYEKKCKLEVKDLQDKINQLNQKIFMKDKEKNHFELQITKLKEQNKRLELLVHKYENVLLNKLATKIQQPPIKLNEHINNIQEMRSHRSNFHQTTQNIAQLLPQKYHCLDNRWTFQEEQSNLSSGHININSIRPSSSPIAKRKLKIHHSSLVDKKEPKVTSFCELLKKQRST